MLTKLKQIEEENFTMIINSENPFFLATNSFTSTTFPTFKMKNTLSVYRK